MRRGDGLPTFIGVRENGRRRDDAGFPLDDGAPRKGEYGSVPPAPQQRASVLDTAVFAGAAATLSSSGGALNGE